MRLKASTRKTDIGLAEFHRHTDEIVSKDLLGIEHVRYSRCSKRDLSTRLRNSELFSGQSEIERKGLSECISYGIGLSDNNHRNF
jgi:hypothetical protein